MTHSSTVRSFLKAAFNTSAEACIISSTSNLMDAYTDAEALVPDVAIISIEFAQLPEFEMLAALFSALDIRWVFVTTQDSGPERRPLHSTRHADIFPVDTRDPPDGLRRQLGALLRVQRPRKVAPPKRTLAAKPGNLDRCLVLIGSSTGGVEALTRVLTDYPSDCPPTLIVQHTGEAFGESLVRLLDARCAAQVVMASNGQAVTRGTVCVAAGYRAHMSLSRRTPLGIRINPGAPVSGHIPSVDVMFRSALPHAKMTVACLLTGMGSDGAAGLLELRKAGARTFAQDQKSSVVYGMPRVAWEMGAAEKQVPLKEMSRTILDTCTEIANSRIPAGK